jgi:hypothetical protein
MLSRLSRLARRFSAGWYRASYFGRRIGDKRIVAGLATMPSRAASFPVAFRSIVDQVDRLYLYLDGHQEVPEVARSDARVIPIFRHDGPKLGTAAKFLGLIREAEPCLYVGIDDDIYYPPSYVAHLHSRLKAHGYRAVVGVHGLSFNRPFASYPRDCTIFHFAGSMRSERAVDILGAGTMMFDTAVFRFDVRKWQQLNMSDLNVAIEATKSGLPMICIARRKNFLFPLGENQSDSAFRALQNDDSQYTSRALELLALRAAENNLAPHPS